MAKLNRITDHLRNVHDGGHMIHYHMSNMEIEVINFIDSICPGIEMIHNDRQEIAPRELDIYIPSRRLAIECDPTWTHGSTQNIFDPNIRPKDIGYHKMKTDMCEERSIRLIHIFSCDWNYKYEVVQSILRSALKQNVVVLDAQDLTFEHLSQKQAMQFITDNTIGGWINARYFGLCKKGIPVCIIGVVKKRKYCTYGIDHYRILRYACLSNIHVHDGLRVLLEGIESCNTKHLNFSVSVDRAYGDLVPYYNLGFKKKRDTDPVYRWVHSQLDISYPGTPEGMRKALDVKSKMHLEENMMENGYVKVYNSGLTILERNRYK